MKRRGMMLIVAITFLSSGFSGKGTWLIDSDSRLSIHGSTNVSKFICKIDCYTGSDTLQFATNYQKCELQFSRNQMTIPIRNFDCGAKQISTDFWKTLKYEAHPQLDINFRSLQTLTIRNNSFVNGIVDISLAGITARYTIRYRVTVIENSILLNGTHPVTFSDFNLVAPEKLKGLIKVKERLNVEFNLVLTQI
jgi:hypothetical protein